MNAPSPSDQDRLQPKTDSPQTLGSSPIDSPQPIDSPATLDFHAQPDAEEIVRILDDYLAAWKAGRPLDRAQLIADHPHLADQLNACLAGLEFIQGVGQSLDGRSLADNSPGAADSSTHAVSSPHPSRTLGDFRILREVGRGGMGAVFEAEQMSLGRRVALKVLRFGGVSDPEALDRFRREAETVARLHHTNIVPIFAVGTDHGVNYYAMQFIEGRSLAEVLAAALAATSTEKRRAIDPQDVAQWGLQAAEALEHAHARGVIHRDVKPSNLLLDAEGRIWLTDFGLARRLDDVTLSLTGALLGTPRYMSPEQASAAKRQVDRRTDIYSLGATLYELLAGQPAFTGESPHDVIQQILSSEPTPLSQICPSLSRDLETIVMKCLAKESDRRYESARDLANDLRAWLENRPIRARRAGMLERSGRWLKRHKSSVSLASITMAATLVVMITAFGGSQAYQSWRQANVSLVTKSPPLVAEFLDDAGDVQSAATVPTQRPIAMVGRDYRVRVSGEGRLSETYAVAIPRGTSPSIHLEVDHGLLWANYPTKRSWVVVRDGAQDRILTISDDGIESDDWRTRLPLNQTKLAAGLPAEFNAPGFSWPWNSGVLTAKFAVDTHDATLDCLPEAIDLNGDQVRDYVFYGLCQAWLMAISGGDGRVLWLAARGSDVRSLLKTANAGIQSGEMVSRVVGTPVTVADLDDDDVPDFVATMVDRERLMAPDDSFANAFPARRWIEAISGATGKTIWERPVPSDWFVGEDGAVADIVPQGWRWGFAGRTGMNMSGSGYSVMNGKLIRFNRAAAQLFGPHVAMPGAARRVRYLGQDFLTIESSRHVALATPADGQVVQSLQLAEPSGKPAEWADLDGDGSDDLVIVNVSAGPTGGGMGMGPAAPTGTRLSAWSPAKQSLLWTHMLPVAPPDRMFAKNDPPRWPVVVDLNGDGRAEVIAPDGNAAMSGGSFGECWGGLAAFDGATGSKLWSRRIATCDMQVDYFLAGPDVDADGWRDVFAATISGLPMAVYVDALSGKTGSRIWTRQHVIPNRPGSDHSDYLANPIWWHAGEDGWPQLVVRAGAFDHHNNPTHWCVFSAGTGEVTRVGVGITSVQPADVDGDGVEDLLTFRAKSEELPNAGGALSCVRGVGRELWRRIGLSGTPSVDLNGDGVRDLLGVAAGNEIAAWCGLRGVPLWRTTDHGFVGSVNVEPLWQPRESDGAGESSPVRAASVGDVDGDGICDLVAWHFESRLTAVAPVAVLSGRTGQRIWTARDMDVRVARGLFACSGVDLDQDGRNEVALITACDLDYPRAANLDINNVQLWLIILNGSDGRVRWRQPLSRPYGQGRTTGAFGAFPLNRVGAQIPWAIADLDGDKVLDILTLRLTEPTVQDRHFEWQAFSGRDGAELWKYSLPRHSDAHSALTEQVPPVIADLDGDGAAEVVILSRHVNPKLQLGSTPFLHVELIAGRDGKSRWRWLSDQPLGSAHGGLSRGGSRVDVSLPVIVRCADGARRVVVQQAGQPCRLWTFDAQGHSQSFTVEQQATRARLWAVDVDHDGADELLYAVAHEVRAARGDRPDSTVWTYATPSGVFPVILGVRSHGADADDTTRTGELDVLFEPTDNAVVTLNASDGAVRWTCPGPQPRDGEGRGMIERVELLNVGKSESAAPRFLFSYELINLVRQSSAIHDVARNSLSTVSRAGYEPVAAEFRVAARVTQPARDLRWQRRLPWALDDTQFTEVAQTVAVSLIWGFAIVFTPVAYMVYVFRRRSWSLRALFGLTGVLGMALAFTMSSALDSWWHGEFQPLERVKVALVAAPPIVLVWLIASWLWTGRRRTAYVWFAVTGALTVVPPLVLLAIDASVRPLQPDEYYVGAGWWIAIVMGIYMTSWIAIVVVPLVGLVKLFLSETGRRRGGPWRDGVRGA